MIRAYRSICLQMVIICLLAQNVFSEPIADEDFVKINGGCFEMGNQFGEGGADELPLHTVCLSGFYLSKYEVTQEQWLQVMGNNPSRNMADPRYPVDVISWYNVEQFIKTLNSRTGKNYRLPTEAEWEYACRAGGEKVKYGTQNGTSSLDLVIHSADDTEYQGVRPVGSFPPNKLGLHDMSGNVSEWVMDLYDRQYYSQSPVDDPKLLDDQTIRLRVRRGGYWGNNEWLLRCTVRNFRRPNQRLIGLGFRLAKDP